MTKSIIHAGVCGFTTHIQATTEDSQTVALKIDTDCNNIRQLAAKLPEVDAYAEIGAGWDGTIHQAARGTLKGCCSGCVVPSGIFKTVQVAASITLPQTATIQVENG